jgi:hypothetical protein
MPRVWVRQQHQVNVLRNPACRKAVGKEQLGLAEAEKWLAAHGDTRKEVNTKCKCSNGLNMLAGQVAGLSSSR